MLLKPKQLAPMGEERAELVRCAIGQSSQPAKVTSNVKLRLTPVRLAAIAARTGNTNG